MPHDVIMPALGMAQDTGLLIAWRKAPGDRVRAGDVLFEVETDKSTMEVEALHDGYLAELRAGAGESVPVGAVIAVLAEEKPEAPVRRPPDGRAAADGDAATEESAAGPAPEPQARGAHGSMSPAAGDRILASPKARRIAAEEGLDLSRLVAEGIAQPYHVADLEALRTLPVPTAANAAASMYLSARVPADGFDSFREWLAAEVDGPVPSTAILAALLTGALRTGPDTAGDALTVAVETPAAGCVVYSDADLAGMAKLQPSSGGRPVILLRDLTATRLDRVRLGAAATPVLTITRSGGEIAMILEAEAGALASDIAIGLLSEFAARLESPLRQLL
jgi:pyruvate/2-oxoglutarate dehydrogenase complex dihydrolipoamide acyltransferase (E2) component